MEYVLLLLEGVLTFISPCILPMIPVYISYFSGGNTGEERERLGVIWNVLGFVLGFTVVFTTVGAMAGTFGALLKDHQRIVNLICGAIVMIFGFNYMGILKLRFLAKSYRLDYRMKTAGFFSSVLFGIVFSIGWTPCVGTFLGSALMLAMYAKNVAKGVVMLLLYSIGLGIPFLLCGIFIESLKDVFAVFKRHYNLINKVAGGILVVTGTLMMTGMFYRWISYLAI